VPELQKAMAQALVDTAASLDTITPDEQIVMVALLSHYPWEDLSGLPQQIMVQGQKKQLLEAQRAGGASLEAAVHVTTY